MRPDMSTEPMGLRPVWDAQGVCVWLCRLDGDCDISLDDARQVASPPERARASQFHFDRDRNRYLRARGFLRERLADCIGATPGAVVIEQTAHGKPVLRGDRVHFNLSHSEGLGVVAISVAHPVGVDLELTNREIDPLVLAPSCFVKHEVQALRDLPAQLQRFFAFWTAKEAFMKLTGEGMRLDPRLISLELDENGWPSGYCVDDRGDASLHYIDLGIAHTTCCLAVPVRANAASLQNSRVNRR